MDLGPKMQRVLRCTPQPPCSRVGQGPRRTEAVRGGALGSGSRPGGLHAVPVGGGEPLRSRGVTSSGPSTKGSASVTSWSQKENSLREGFTPEARSGSLGKGDRGQVVGEGPHPRPPSRLL